ncbi:hypothetical protein [Streptomyces sp. R44]|uniref:HEAT repeat domain-containing protein n=1 Tax=Streptomyces sp. R44 TaxID=3238633 RepID=A0AB39T4W8_9ACTN
MLRLEEELSRAAPGDLPLEALKSRLLALWEEEDFPGAARELTEAAWSRPLEQATELLYWLCEAGVPVAAEAFVVDVARLRPLDDVLETHPAVKEFGGASMQEMWMSTVAGRVTRGNAAAVYEGLWRSDGDDVLAEAVRRVDSDDDAVALVLAALSGQPDPAGLTELSRVLASGRPSDRLGLRVIVGLAEAGRADVATHVLAVALRRVSYTDVARWMTALRSEQIDILLDLVPRLDDGLLMTMFTSHLWREEALFDRLLTAMARQGRLDALDPTMTRTVAQAIARWRRSRGQ